MEVALHVCTCARQENDSGISKKDVFISPCASCLCRTERSDAAAAGSGASRRSTGKFLPCLNSNLNHNFQTPVADIHDPIYDFFNCVAQVRSLEADLRLQRRRQRRGGVAGEDWNDPHTRTAVTKPICCLVFEYRTSMPRLTRHALLVSASHREKSPAPPRSYGKVVF